MARDTDLGNIIGGARAVDLTNLSEAERTMLSVVGSFPNLGIGTLVTRLAREFDIPAVIGPIAPRPGTPAFRNTVAAGRTAREEAQARAENDDDENDDESMFGLGNLTKSAFLGAFNAFLGPVATPVNLGRIALERVLSEPQREPVFTETPAISFSGGRDVLGTASESEDILGGDNRPGNQAPGNITTSNFNRADEARAREAAGSDRFASGAPIFGQQGSDVSGSGQPGSDILSGDNGVPTFGGAQRGGIYRRQGGVIPESTVPGQTMAPVGATVHEGEFVIRPEAVKAIGIDKLEELNRMGGTDTLQGGESTSPVVVSVGGAQLRLPPGATQETIQAAIAHFRTTPEFDKLVDKQAGAPARVRTIVGSSPNQDRLANLQRFYPDAVPYGDDNFVFTDPGSGRPTLYNPEGLDVGDIASVAREGVQAIGGGIGAAGGAVIGAGLGAPTGPGAALTASQGAAIGAGVGTVAAGSLFDFTMNMFGERIDTRSPGRIVLEGVTEFGSAASGQRIGELLPLAFKRSIGAARSGTQALIDTFRRLGIEPPAGAATGSRAIGTVEKMLESTPSSAAIIQESAERVMAQTRSAADDITSRFGTALDRTSAGEAIKTAARRAVTVFEDTQERIYNDVFDMIGDDTIVPLANVQALRRQLQQQLSRAPESLARALTPTVRRLQAMEADATEAGGIAFGALRQIRTNLGRELAAPVLVGSRSQSNEAMKQAYGALTQDLAAAARDAGPEAARNLARADRYTRLFMNTSAKTLEKITRFEADEKAFDYVWSMSKDGTRMLARLRRHFTDEEWDTVAASVLAKMGRAKPNAQDATGDVFSVSTFLTNWSTFRQNAPESLNLLFGGRRYADLAGPLDDLVTAVSSLKGMERLTNTSNTGRVVNAWMTMQTLMAGLTGFAITGDPTAAASAAVGGYLAPRWAARLITNPSFVQWLATPVTNPTGISAHLGRLTELAVAEPQIEEEIGQYLSALRDVMQQEPAYTGPLETKQ